MQCEDIFQLITADWSKSSSSKILYFGWLGMRKWSLQLLSKLEQHVGLGCQMHKTVSVLVTNKILVGRTNVEDDHWLLPLLIFRWFHYSFIFLQQWCNMYFWFGASYNFFISIFSVIYNFKYNVKCQSSSIKKLMKRARLCSPPPSRLPRLPEPAYISWGWGAYV